MYQIERLPSKAGRREMVCIRIDNEFCYTFWKNNRQSNAGRAYYYCNQCNGVEKTAPTDREKAVHLDGDTIVNGHPTIGHCANCRPIAYAAVHAEKSKRAASYFVGMGIATVSKARLEMEKRTTMSCAEKRMRNEHDRIMKK